MRQLCESNDRLEFSEQHSLVFRLMFTLAGLCPFLAPWELLVKPHWPREMDAQVLVALAVPLVISTAAVAVGLMILFATWAAPDTSVSIDRTSGSLTQRIRRFGRGWQRINFPLSDLMWVRTQARTWDDMPEIWSLILAFRGGHRLTVGEFEQVAEADRVKTLIEQMAWPPETGSRREPVAAMPAEALQATAR